MGTPLHQYVDSVQAHSTGSDESEKYVRSYTGSAHELHEPFRSLDNPGVLEESMQALITPLSRNFVVEFGDSHAHVAFDFDPSSFQQYLDLDRPNALSTRWINIWYPYQQRSMLEMLGQLYDFSPRLLALMCSDPRRPPRSPQSTSYAIAAEQERSLSGLGSEHSNRSRSRRSPDAVSTASSNGSRTGNLYDIVDEVWHYSSVDQGRSYLCLGFNSLYSIGHLCPDDSQNDGKSDSEQLRQPLPHVKRVWTWLLLLSDRTVITITEDLFPYSQGYITPIQNHILFDTRRNLKNVFRSLSKVEMHGREKSPLTLLPIRRRLGETPQETAHRTSDAPGLLFYYLFENWENSYSLVTRKESRYGIELQRVRKEMFKSPKLTHIDRLDQIGSQLAVLKRHYNSYIRLIDRVVQPQQASLASLVNTRVASKSSGESLICSGSASVPDHAAISAMNTWTGQPTSDPIADGGDIGETVVTAAGTLLGVGLSSAARVRFERLRDMISLYALTECEDYLHQKESFVQMVGLLIMVVRLLYLTDSSTELSTDCYQRERGRRALNPGSLPHLQGHCPVPPCLIHDVVLLG